MDSSNQAALQKRAELLFDQVLYGMVSAAVAEKALQQLRADDAGPLRGALLRCETADWVTVLEQRVKWLVATENREDGKPLNLPPDLTTGTSVRLEKPQNTPTLLDFLRSSVEHVLNLGQYFSDEDRALFYSEVIRNEAGDAVFAIPRQVLLGLFGMRKDTVTNSTRGKLPWVDYDQRIKVARCCADLAKLAGSPKVTPQMALEAFKDTVASEQLGGLTDRVNSNLRMLVHGAQVPPAAAPPPPPPPPQEVDPAQLPCGYSKAMSKSTQFFETFKARVEGGGYLDVQSPAPGCRLRKPPEPDGVGPTVTGHWIADPESPGSDILYMNVSNPVSAQETARLFTGFNEVPFFQGQGGSEKKDTLMSFTHRQIPQRHDLQEGTAEAPPVYFPIGGQYGYPCLPTDPISEDVNHYIEFLLDLAHTVCEEICDTSLRKVTGCNSDAKQINLIRNSTFGAHNDGNQTLLADEGEVTEVMPGRYLPSDEELLVCTFVATNAQNQCTSKYDIWKVQGKSTTKLGSVDLDMGQRVPGYGFAFFQMQCARGNLACYKHDPSIINSDTELGNVWRMSITGRLTRNPFTQTPTDYMRYVWAALPERQAQLVQVADKDYVTNVRTSHEAYSEYSTVAPPQDGDENENEQEEDEEEAGGRGGAAAGGAPGRPPHRPQSGDFALVEPWNRDSFPKMPKEAFEQLGIYKKRATASVGNESVMQTYLHHATMKQLFRCGYLVEYQVPINAEGAPVTVPALQTMVTQEGKKKLLTPGNAYRSAQVLQDVGLLSNWRQKEFVRTKGRKRLRRAAETAEGGEEEAAPPDIKTPGVRLSEHYRSDVNAVLTYLAAFAEGKYPFDEAVSFAGGGGNTTATDSQPPSASSANKMQANHVIPGGQDLLGEAQLALYELLNQNRVFALFVNPHSYCKDLDPEFFQGKKRVYLRKKGWEQFKRCDIFLGWFIVDSIVQQRGLSRKKLNKLYGWMPFERRQLFAWRSENHINVTAVPWMTKEMLNMLKQRQLDDPPHQFPPFRTLRVSPQKGKETFLLRLPDGFKREMLVIAGEKTTDRKYAIDSLLLNQHHLQMQPPEADWNLEDNRYDPDLWLRDDEDEDDGSEDGSEEDGSEEEAVEEAEEEAEEGGEEEEEEEEVGLVSREQDDDDDDEEQGEEQDEEQDEEEGDRDYAQEVFTADLSEKAQISVLGLVVLCALNNVAGMCRALGAGTWKGPSKKEPDSHVLHSSPIDMDPVDRVVGLAMQIHPVAQSNTSLEPLVLIQRDCAMESGYPLERGKRIPFGPDERKDRASLTMLTESLLRSVLIRFCSRLGNIRQLRLLFGMEQDLPRLDEMSNYVRRLADIVEAQCPGDRNAAARLLWTKQFAESLPHQCRSMEGLLAFFLDVFDRLTVDAVEAFFRAHPDPSWNDSLVWLKKILSGAVTQGKVGDADFYSNKILSDVDQLFEEAFGEPEGSSVRGGSGAKDGTILLNNHIMAERRKILGLKSAGKPLTPDQKAQLDSLKRFKSVGEACEEVVRQVHNTTGRNVVPNLVLETLDMHRNKDGLVIVDETGDVFNVNHAEHFICKGWVHVKFTTAAKTKAARPDLDAYHCHPQRLQGRDIGPKEPPENRNLVQDENFSDFARYSNEAVLPRIFPQELLRRVLPEDFGPPSEDSQQEEDETGVGSGEAEVGKKAFRPYDYWLPLVAKKTLKAFLKCLSIKVLFFRVPDIALLPDEGHPPRYEDFLVALHQTKDKIVRCIMAEDDMEAVREAASDAWARQQEELEEQRAEEKEEETSASRMSESSGSNGNGGDSNSDMDTSNSDQQEQESRHTI